MNKIELSGVLKFDYNGYFPCIKLVQSDGYKIDLVNRISEIISNAWQSKIQVSYFLSDKPITRKEMIEGFLKYFYGYAQAEYEKSDYAYSSLTSGTDYDTHLKIGEHDLFS